jgi:Virulence factor
MRREHSQVVVIMWRDIPAQVNGQKGRERHQVLLAERFQNAISRAKRKARIVTADDDVAQWRRVTTPCDGDPATEAAVVAARLDAEYPEDRLGRIAHNAGVDATV